MYHIIFHNIVNIISTYIIIINSLNKENMKFNIHKQTLGNIMSNCHNIKIIDKGWVLSCALYGGICGPFIYITLIRSGFNLKTCEK
jgi:hypothetical protein